MSFTEKTFYKMTCDTPGCDSDLEAEFVYWSDKDDVIEMAESSDWLVTDEGKHFCTNHWVFNEDSSSSEDRIPAPFTVGKTND